ncbi:MAG: peptidyl-prolyl cis-trans isomerase [Phycisphaerales bacterium]
MKRTLKLDMSDRNTTICALLLSAGIAVSSGCNVQKIKGNTQKESTKIQIADFQGTPETAAAQAQSLTTTSQGGNTPLEAQAESEPRPTQQPVLTASSNTVNTAPRPSNKPAITSGEQGLEFLDAKVGDISGLPIYVSSFFAPIEARLTALGNDLQLGAWREQAITIINIRLNGIIYDELLRAETIAALTPQQRVGLQSFLNNFRSNLLSENLGSTQLANQRILEQEGITLDEAIRQKELDTLVGITLYEEINRRINISWRDIKQRYERDIDRFQPPPSVTLQVIRVLEPEGELVDSITARLNAGEDFGEIAASEVNSFNKDTSGVTETVLEEDFGETKFFAPAPLNEAVWGLSEGDWTGPVSLGNANFWILYADKKQESTSLYDAQIQLNRELTLERREIERGKYLEGLFERAGVSNREEILLRLLYISEQKFGPNS